MVWWYWMILGAILFGTELMVIDAQFYLVFIGISAALVGLAGMLGLDLPEWAQWVTFAAMSLAFFFTFRKMLYMKIRGGMEGFRDSLSGDSVEVPSDMAPGSSTRIEHRGSAWTAVNIGDGEIASGARAKIIEVDGLTLHISAD